MGHIQIPEGKFERKDKVMLLHKKTNEFHYVEEISNPRDDSIINGEFLEFKITNYDTETYVGYIRPSELLEQYVVSSEGLIKIIKQLSKVVREQQSLLKEAKHELKEAKKYYV